VLEGIVTWAEIDLDASTFNIQAFKKHVGDGVKLIAVVKANAMGMALCQWPKPRWKPGRAACGAPRHRGRRVAPGSLQAPILVMGYTPPDGADLVIQHRLTPSLMTIESPRLCRARQRAGHRSRCM